MPEAQPSWMISLYHNTLLLLLFLYLLFSNQISLSVTFYVCLVTAIINVSHYQMMYCHYRFVIDHKGEHQKTEVLITVCCSSKNAELIAKDLTMIIGTWS